MEKNVCIQEVQEVLSFNINLLKVKYMILSSSVLRLRFLIKLIIYLQGFLRQEVVVIAFLRQNDTNVLYQCRRFHNSAHDIYKEKASKEFLVNLVLLGLRLLLVIHD